LKLSRERGLKLLGKHACIKESSAAVVVQKINICSDHKSVPYWGVKIAEGYDLRGIETARERGVGLGD